MTQESKAIEGGCLCGKVGYSATMRPGTGACHCGMCRKWSGGPFMAVHAEGAVDFSGEEHISRFSSSQWAERGFCSHCGTSLFYHLLPRPGVPGGMYAFAAGTVGDQTLLNFDHEVYIDHAPGWYAFAGEDQRQRSTEKELLEMFGVDG